MANSKEQTKKNVSPGVVVVKPRAKFTRAALQDLIDRVGSEGFVGFRLALMMYRPVPHRVYIEVPGQSIRFRAFDTKALMELLERVDEAVQE